MRAPCLILSAITLAATLPAAPARADIHDVRVDESAGEGRIWLAFDEQPAAAELALDGGSARLRVAGVNVRERSIETVRRDAIDIVTMPGGAEIRLPSPTRWETARAEIREGGVLITYAGEAGPSTDAAAAPEARFVPASALVAAPAATGDVNSAAAETPSPVSSGAPSGAPSGLAPGETRAAPARLTATPDEAVDRPDETMAESGAEAAPVPAPVSAEAMSACEIAAAAVEADPWNFAVLGDHAACLADQEQTAAAREIYERILAFEPENYAAAIGLAQISAESGDTLAAREFYSQAAGAASSDAEAAYAWSRARDLPGR